MVKTQIQLFNYDPNCIQTFTPLRLRTSGNLLHPFQPLWKTQLDFPEMCTSSFPLSSTLISHHPTLMGLEVKDCLTEQNNSRFNVTRHFQPHIIVLFAARHGHRRPHSRKSSLRDIQMKGLTS